MLDQISKEFSKIDEIKLTNQEMLNQTEKKFQRKDETGLNKL